MAIDPDLDPADLRPWLRRDALAWGHTDKEIARLVGRGEWARVRHGAYIKGSLWASLSPEDKHRVRARAVLRTGHESAVLSHVSAAVEWGAPVYGVDLDLVHVTRSDARPGRSEACVVRHSGLLPDSQVTNVNGVRVTRGSRTALELATVTSTESALVSINGLLHAGHATRDELHDLAVVAKSWPGSMRLPVVVRLCDGRIESAGETRLQYLIWREGLPRPQPQVEVRDVSGHLVGRCDFAWPEWGIFIEFDGKEKYRRHLRAGEDPTDRMLAQHRREEAIIRATGWVCLRVIWEDLQRPHVLARRIREVLALRGHRA